MNSDEDILETSVNELSNIDDEFDSLLKEEDVSIGSEKGKHDLNFNELFEQMLRFSGGDSRGQPRRKC